LYMFISHLIVTHGEVKHIRGNIYSLNILLLRDLFVSKQYK
jgi:hypothetical protein